MAPNIMWFAISSLGLSVPAANGSIPASFLPALMRAMQKKCFVIHLTQRDRSVCRSPYSDLEFMCSEVCAKGNFSAWTPLVDSARLVPPDAFDTLVVVTVLHDKRGA